MAGLEITGFTTKTLLELQNEQSAALLAGVSPTLNLSSTSLLGQWVAVTARQIRQVWEAAGEVYASMDIEQAEGDALTSRCKLVGIFRRASTKSTVDVDLTLPAGTYAAGTQILHVDGDPEARFVNAEEIVSAGTALTNVPFVAESEGAVRANADTLDQIASGSITSVQGNDAAAVGLEEETDAELRRRWRQSVALVGSTSVDAIRADILTVENVTSCTVYENTTDTTDANGIPSRAIMAVVRGGTGSDVAAALFTAKAAGIQTYGNTTETHVDSQGVSHDVNFSIPTQVRVYVSATVSVLSGVYPASADQTVERAIKDCGSYWGAAIDSLGGPTASDGTWPPGHNVLASRIRAAIMLMPGVVDVTSLTLGTSASPVGTGNITIDVDEFASIGVTSPSVSGDVVVTINTLTAVP
jgi:uncharacterized phage protein gp47/JayE